MFGRIFLITMAMTACGAPRDAASRLTAKRRVVPDFARAGIAAPILDNQVTTLPMPVTASGIVGGLSIHVSLTHTYIGDLRIRLVEPQGAEIILHDQSGGATANLDQIYGDGGMNVDLSPVLHRDVEGDWRLIIEDNAGRDEGTLDAVELSILKV